MESCIKSGSFRSQSFTVRAFSIVSASVSRVCDVCKQRNVTATSTRLCNQLVIVVCLINISWYISSQYHIVISYSIYSWFSWLYLERTNAACSGCGEGLRNDNHQGGLSLESSPESKDYTKHVTPMLHMFLCWIPIWIHEIQSWLGMRSLDYDSLWLLCIFHLHGFDGHVVPFNVRRQKPCQTSNIGSEAILILVWTSVAKSSIVKSSL